MAAEGTTSTATSSLESEHINGSPEECGPGDAGEAATATAYEGDDASEAPTATAYEGDDALSPQGNEANAMSSLELEHTNHASEEGSTGSSSMMEAATIIEGDDTDGSYIFIDHAESDGTGEGDPPVIPGLVVPVQDEVAYEGKGNCLHNFPMMAEDLNQNSSSSPPVEDGEVEILKVIENDILLQAIGAQTADSVHVEPHNNNPIFGATFNVAYVANGENQSFKDPDFVTNDRQLISEAPAVKIGEQDARLQLELLGNRGSCENQLQGHQGYMETSVDVPIEEEINSKSISTGETNYTSDEKITAYEDVKSSSKNDEIGKSPPGNLLQKPDNSLDAKISFGMKDSITPLDCHGGHNCDENVGIPQTMFVDSIANVEVYNEYQKNVPLSEVAMDCSVQEHLEDGSDNDAKVSNNENDSKEAIVDHLTPSPVDVYFAPNTKFYVVRIPRISDNKLSEQVNLAERQLEERSQKRDLIRKELQNRKAICNEYGKDFNDAKTEEKVARQAFFAKRKEIEELKNTMASINTQGIIDGIVTEMQHLEHKMQHETMPLKHEKLLLRRLKELKQTHASLSSKLAASADLHKEIEDKSQIEGQIKHLSIESENLKNKMLQAKTKTDSTKRKCDEEYNILRELQAQHKVADDLRQQAYLNMRSIKKELSLKNTHFYRYKDDMNVAASYVSSGNLKALQKHCFQQVEMAMKLWNKDDEFRKTYMQSNLFSTIRRFKTLDGRSLGPDEEPVTFPRVGRKPETNPLVLPKAQTSQHAESTHENANTILIPAGVDCSSLNVVPKKIPEESEKQSIPKPETTSASDVTEQKNDRVAKLDDEAVYTRTADELAREQLMKQEAAEELKAKVVAEQKAKRKEAEERKRRKAEKAKALAEIRTQREAELREKKRAKKRTENIKSCENDISGGGNDADSSPACIAEVAGVPENKDIISEKPLTGSTVVKLHNKTKPLPPPLRHKGKRKSQTLTWVLLLSVMLVILFWAGNHFSLYSF